MTTEEITLRHKELENQIIGALTIHVKSNAVKVAREQLLNLQRICPHEEGKEVCPYCGVKL